MSMTPLELSGKTDRIANLIKEVPGAQNYYSIARHLLENGVDVTLPAEPEWKPGQYARLTKDGERYTAHRGTKGYWYAHVPAGAYVAHDQYVTDVEPVAVLTAEDGAAVAMTTLQVERLDFFRARGLSV